MEGNENMKRILATWIATLMCLFLSMAVAATQTNKLPWHEWVAELRQEALDDGIRPEVFDQAFSTVKEPTPKVVSLDRSQPEKRLTFLQYRKTRIDPYRITLGVRYYKKYQGLLDKIAAEYRVDPFVITALWGIESSYGNYMGTFPVISSLATLAYDGRRSEFFRHELLLALHILNDDQVAFSDFKGEWAGGSGQPQFLPSSWQKYAVDYDGDGRRNIWTSKPDVIASIANYLKKNGWQLGEPWALQINLPESLQNEDIEDEEKTVHEWRELGVKVQEGQWPNDHLTATIVRPLGGPDFLVFNNFHTLLQYNNSNYYAGSVGYLADEIRKRVRGG